MKIGFDGKRAIKNNTGLGNYSRLVVEELAQQFPDNKYVLYTPEYRANKRLERIESLPNVSFITPESATGRAIPSLWRVWGETSQLKRDAIDIMHGLSGELPLNIGRSGVKSVVTIHDLIFQYFPNYYHSVDRRIYDYKFRHAANNASRVIAISECTKRDIVEFYHVDPDKIDVIYQGCDPQFHRTPTPHEIASVKRKYGLDRPYIISVGTIEERKNQIQAVRGLRGLPDELDLVLVGRRTVYAKTIDAYISAYAMGNRVKFIESADFADLPALYAGAFCSSYTSRYEGFGIPVIESLNVGTPVIVAAGSCLEEAGGIYTPVVNPDDMEEWINTVKEMINYPNVHEKIAKAGHEYVKRFDNAEMARNIMATYRKALEQ